MILSRRVALGGVQLDELDPSIVIRSFDPGTPKETVTSTPRMGGSGSRLTGARYDTLDAVLTYAIDIPKRMLAERRAVFDLVNAWALKGGWLTADHMKNRRMRVDRAAVPSSADLWNWTEEFQITFRAFNVPFWQDEEPVSVAGKTAASGSISIQVSGNTESVLDAVFENKSGKTIQNFTIKANGNQIKLENLNLGGSAKLAISHGTDGLLRIKAGSTSVYENYTGADDLYVNPGNTAVTWTADRAGVLTVSSYGRYV